MKKIMILLALLVSVITTNAQFAKTMPLVAGDSAVNTGTVTKTLPTLTAGYAGIVIQPIATKYSGTAAGTVVLYESLDGTNYKTTGDTMTLTNVTTNTTIWRKTAPVPVYYQVKEYGSGTMGVVLTIKYVLRKYDTE